MIAGRDGFVTEAGKWAVLCPMVFDGIKWADDAAADAAAADAAAADSGRILEPSAFVPDFSARLTSNARVMRVTRDQFIKAMRATRYPQIIQEAELNKPENSVDMTSQIGDEKVLNLSTTTSLEIFIVTQYHYVHSHYQFTTFNSISCQS